MFIIKRRFFDRDFKPVLPTERPVWARGYSQPGRCVSNGIRDEGSHQAL